jgi:predicted ATPase
LDSGHWIHPLLLCIDDVHWADQASLRFLNYLGRRLEELPIVVVAAARPSQLANGTPLLAGAHRGPAS